MNVFYRYPLPVMFGGLLAIAASFLTGYWLWEPGVSFTGQKIALLGGFVAFLVVFLFVSFLTFAKARALCVYVAAVLPPCWAFHARLAELLGNSTEVDYRGRTVKKVIGLARFRAHPKLKRGAVWLPVKTTEGKLNRRNCDALANDLAAVFSMASAETIWPDSASNRGYCWFVLSSKDHTVN